ncbi:MAG: hypothetical protein COA78_14250 [Blastopirellula sp.]|nr:MAG: hypothetical protein COA78_14250 [Blastopirellula sp.]
MADNTYDQIADTIQTAGPAGTVDFLVNLFREQKKYYELFELLKMQARLKLGLPILYTDDGDELSEEQRNQLEDALIEACREVGGMLLDEDRIREGWYYLRPVGDKQPVIDALHRAKVDEENVEDLIEVALQEGVDPEFGFQLVLDHYGTCNSITTFEQQIAPQPSAVQRPIAALLLKHLHEELRGSLTADIAQREGNDPTEATIGEMIASREWLFDNSGYHIDTSHLSSTVRFAKVLNDPELLKLARDLTLYGQCLDPQFQYEQQPPFDDFYDAHLLYFNAIIGDEIDESLAFFKEKAQASDIRQEGSLAIETYISLLSQSGKHAEALDAALSLIPAGVHTQNIAPSLIELSEAAGDFGKLSEHCKSRDDLLGFATSMLQGSDLKK